MNVSVEKIDSESIRCNNETFLMCRLTRISNSVTYQCANSKCLAKITLNKNKDKILTANLVHNNHKPSNESPLNTSSKKKSISKTDKTKSLNSLNSRKTPKTVNDNAKTKTSSSPIIKTPAASNSSDNNTKSKLLHNNQSSSILPLTPDNHSNHSDTSSLPTAL